MSPAAGGGHIAVQNTVGSNLLDADQDVLLGTAGQGHVIAGASVSVLAGRDLIMDNNTLVEADLSGAGGDITVAVGRNITLDKIGIGFSRLVTFGSGSIALTTGAGGVFTNKCGGTSVEALGGILIRADDIVMIGTSIKATAGIITLQQAGTTARPISVGAGAVAGSLGLSDTELGLITAGTLASVELTTQVAFRSMAP